MTATRPAPAVLEGRFVRLSPLTEADLPELQSAIGHPSVFAGGYGGGPQGYRESPADFAEWAHSYYQWGVGLPLVARVIGGEHDGVLVGTSTLGDFDERLEHAHIGWTAWDPRVWGSQVNPEAKLLMLQLAFDSGFGRVKLQADVRNDRSRAAIAGIGASFEGIVRRDRPRADGSWRDSAVFSIIAPEWPEVRGRLEERLERWAGEPVRFRDPGFRNH
jgi:RimJ/RimL family protein N-acetyltransferase